ncbi:MAG: carbohydrate ABC transporter permease [Bacillota bacterium]|nr:carbohydrate ABC transporter permease [Bacillota bacterium]
MKESRAEKVFSYFNIGFLSILAIVTVYPLIYVLFASLSDPTQLMSHTGALIKPLGFSIKAYEMVFSFPNITRGYINTIIIVVGGVAVNILMTSFGAYFLSRKNIFIKKYIMLGIVFTMFFSGGLIPLYLVVNGIGLRDNLLALILPVSINTTNLIILRTAFMAVPESLVESAEMDGAGHFTLLFKVMIPLAKPTVATLVLFYAVYHWNSWFNASIFLQNEDLYPLQLILREILILGNTTSISGGVNDANVLGVADAVKYSVIVFATLPILCLYPFLQKYFVKGVMIGAVKG